MKRTQNNRNTIRKTQKKKSHYSRSDFQSNDGMLTSVWGPSMWHYLHTMSFNYPAKPTCDENKLSEFCIEFEICSPLREM